jgi:hypothetical protein
VYTHTCVCECFREGVNCLIPLVVVRCIYMCMCWEVRLPPEVGGYKHELDNWVLCSWQWVLKYLVYSPYGYLCFSTWISCSVLMWPGNYTQSEGSILPEPGSSSRMSYESACGSDTLSAANERSIKAQCSSCLYCEGNNPCHGSFSGPWAIPYRISQVQEQQCP